MKRTTLGSALALATAALTGLTVAPAQASTGQVVIYSGSQTPLSVYKNPTGCQNFTTGARPPTTILMNETDSPVYYFGQRNCPTATETLEVQPGYGNVLPLNAYGYYSIAFN